MLAQRRDRYNKAKAASDSARGDFLALKKSTEAEARNRHVVAAWPPAPVAAAAQHGVSELGACVVADRVGGCGFRADAGTPVQRHLVPYNGRHAPTVRRRGRRCSNPLRSPRQACVRRAAASQRPSPPWRRSAAISCWRRAQHPLGGVSLGGVSLGACVPLGATRGHTTANARALGSNRGSHWAAAAICQAS